MTGPEYDEDESEFVRPVPHPDDRLWRHPSEVASIKAAQANADTIEVPHVKVDERSRRSRKNTALVIAAGIVVVGAAALVVGVASAPRSSRSTPVAAVPAVSAGGENTQAISSTTDVAADITTEGQAQLSARVHESVAPSLPRIQAATSNGMREGSGFFVTDGGHIATSAGLVEGAEYVLAWTEDGQRWKATVVATDPISDIAVIHIDSQEWPSVALGSATVLRTGQFAFALDHEENSISVGEVVSVGGSTVIVDQPAALPGSAIVDDTGAVIAMVTADGSDRAATPAWILEQVAVDLIASGQTTHVWLGVLIEEASAAPPTEMVLVADVIADSPAAQAGLLPGDLVDSVNGTPTPDAAALYQVIQSAHPGDEAELTVTRDGERRTIVVTLAELTN